MITKALRLAFVIEILAGPAMAADATIPGYRIDDSIPKYKNDVFQPVTYKTKLTTVYNWTGPYVGLNVGGEIGKSAWNSPSPAIPASSLSISGGAVGGTFGYNYQFDHWVTGVDADLDWMNARGSATCPILGVCTTRSPWLGTVRGRVGYASDRLLPYATVGPAFGQLAVDATTPNFSSSSMRFGFAAGGGLEYTIFGPWTGKAEYLYVNLSKLNCPLCNPAGPFSVDYNLHLFRLGLNYRY